MSMRVVLKGFSSLSVCKLETRLIDFDCPLTPIHFVVPEFVILVTLSTFKLVKKSFRIINVWLSALSKWQRKKYQKGYI